MPIDIEVFLSSPHLATNIDTLKKEDLISLAKHFEITINSQMKKNEIKKVVVAKLVENGLIQKSDIEEEKQENKPVKLQWTALREIINEIGESPRIRTSCKF